MEHTRSTSRYEQVADTLRAAIQRGEYRPGDALPSEIALGEQFGLSRPTIRQAIALLRAEGLVAAEHGKGTFVRPRPPLRLPFARYSRSKQSGVQGPYESTVAALGLKGYGEVVSVERKQADSELAARFGVAEGAELVYRRRHYHLGDDDEIIQIQEGYLPLSLVDGTVLAGTKKVQEGTYAALRSIGHAPASITEEVSARMPTPDEEAILRPAPRTPVLQIVRTTHDIHEHVVEVLFVTAISDRNIFVYDRLPVDWHEDPNPAGVQS